MDYAAMECSLLVVRMLVQHDGDIAHTNALHAAAAADPREETDPVERNKILAFLLNECGMDIDAWSTWDDGPPRGGRNVCGTPLHCAIQSNNLSTAAFLIGAGADLKVTNVLGSTPIAYAKEYGSKEMQQLVKPKALL